jgi:hypothetical protein
VLNIRRSVGKELAGAANTNSCSSFTLIAFGIILTFGFSRTLAVSGTQII